MAAGKLSVQDKIGVRVGKVINQYKVAEHVALTITDAALSWERRPDSIASETALGGLYIIRTSVPDTQMDAPECVRNYKARANVERAFRSLKTIDLKVRPIHHRTADRVRAHIFLCMLSCYVEWHLPEFGVTGSDTATFAVTTTASPLHQRALASRTPFIRSQKAVSQ